MINSLRQMQKYVSALMVDDKCVDCGTPALEGPGMCDKCGCCRSCCDKNLVCENAQKADLMKVERTPGFTEQSPDVSKVSGSSGPAFLSGMQKYVSDQVSRSFMFVGPFLNVEFEDDRWVVIRAEDPVEAAHFSADTRWHLKEEKWAKEYLDKGPIYFVLEKAGDKKAEVRMAYHPATGTCMDTQDRPCVLPPEVKDKLPPSKGEEPVQDSSWRSSMKKYVSQEGSGLPVRSFSVRLGSRSRNINNPIAFSSTPFSLEELKKEVTKFHALCEENPPVNPNGYGDMDYLHKMMDLFQVRNPKWDFSRQTRSNPGRYNPHIAMSAIYVFSTKHAIFYSGPFSSMVDEIYFREEDLPSFEPDPPKEETIKTYIDPNTGKEISKEQMIKDVMESTEKNARVLHSFPCIVSSMKKYVSQEALQPPAPSAPPAPPAAPTDAPGVEQVGVPDGPVPLKEDMEKPGEEETPVPDAPQFQPQPSKPDEPELAHDLMIKITNKVREAADTLAWGPEQDHTGCYDLLARLSNAMPSRLEFWQEKTDEIEKLMVGLMKFRIDR